MGEPEMQAKVFGQEVLGGMAAALTMP